MVLIFNGLYSNFFKVLLHKFWIRVKWFVGVFNLLGTKAIRTHYFNTADKMNEPKLIRIIKPLITLKDKLKILIKYLKITLLFDIGTHFPECYNP